MAMIRVTNMCFAYEGSYEPLFENLSLVLDSGWRLGLIGRNGRGKTTLLRLLSGELTPQGSIEMPLTPTLFPFSIPDCGQTTLAVLRVCAPEAPQWRLTLETNKLGLPEALLARPYATLSRGEQTKAQLAALFARQDAYPLIDEPTNHLDLEGREVVANYLARKDGFLLVSHDRDFLNRCIDHTLSLERAAVAVRKGNFDTWQREWSRQNQNEQAQNERLEKDVKRLAQAARRQEAWSRKAEKGKYNVRPRDVAAVDRGYVGARSAAMMKRSLVTKARIENSIAEKQGLLQNVERVGTLKLSPLTPPKQRLVDAVNAAVRYAGRTVAEGITFTVERGERVALLGRNGAGKSSVLQTVCGLSNALQGDVRVAGGLTISHVPQSAAHLRGSLADFIAQTGADQTLFKAILRNMDFGRQQFDKTIEQYSEGQKKKLLLARSLCQQAHLYVWDEPLNYLDIFSRLQLETLILQAEPTLLLVEHDRAFLQRVCTKVVEVQPV